MCIWGPLGLDCVSLETWISTPGSVSLPRSPWINHLPRLSLAPIAELHEDEMRCGVQESTELDMN